MTTVSTRINNKKIISGYVDIYKNKSNGISIGAEAFFFIRRKTLEELKGKFTKQELTLMIDSLNSTMLIPELSTSQDVFIAHLQDADKYEYLGEKYTVAVKMLTQKISQLTSAQVNILQLELKRFWDVENTGNNLDEFIQTFL